jgi:hypothetical protein
MSKTTKNQENTYRRKTAPKNKNFQSQELRYLRELVLLQRLHSPPPKWRAVQPMFRSVRWSATAAQAETDFTIQNMLAAQMMAITSTSASYLAVGVRLKRVQIWFTSPSLGTNVSAELEWNAAGTGFLEPQTAVSATSSSTTEYSYLDARPPADCLASWYQGGSTAITNAIFSFSLPADGIIQVDFDWVPNLGEAGLGSIASSGLLAGTVYCRAINANVLPLAPLNSMV